MKLLEVKELVKSYGNRRVVNNVSLTVQRGEIVGLLGPNGAGKTTTFYMIVGIIPPDKGSIFFDNQTITHLPIHVRSRFGIGYLSQEPSVFSRLTVEENIMAVLETMPMSWNNRRRRLEELLQELNIEHLSNSKAYTLSGGEKKTAGDNKGIGEESFVHPAGRTVFRHRSDCGERSAGDHKRPQEEGDRNPDHRS